MIQPTLWPSRANEISIRPTTAPSGEYVRPSGHISSEPLSVDVDDWGILFRAVIERLERIADVPLDVTPALDVLGTAVDLRVGVRECAEALHLLHTMFVQDASRQRRHLIAA